MAAGMATGMAWFKVPSAIKFVLKGKFSPCVSGKDLILHIIGMIGVDGALYKSMEFTGPGVASLTMEDRLCVCNMAIEAGAKNGIFPVDEVTRAYLNGRSQRTPVYYEADPDAEYEKTIEIDLDKLEPRSATLICRRTPTRQRGKGHPDRSGGHRQLHQWPSGGYGAAYNILKGKHIAKGVRGIIIPATMAVYKECILRGWTEAFIDAGCIVSTPTCGPCLGGYMGILAEGERCVSTTNRNFVGRMGHVKSEVYLASPATAAASALTGYITDPARSDRKGETTMNAKGSVFKYPDNVDTDVIIPARHLNTQDPRSWPATAWRTSTRTLSGTSGTAMLWWAAGTSAAAPPVSTPPWPSRPQASRWSLPRALPASSTATASTSVCPSWSAPRLWIPSAQGIPSAWILLPAHHR